MLTILLRAWVRDIHQPLVTFVETALCESYPHGQNGSVVELTTAGPARRVRVPLLVDHMMLRERCGQASSDQEIGNEQRKKDHFADVVCKARVPLTSAPSEQVGGPDSYRSFLRHRAGCVMDVNFVAAALRRLYVCRFWYRTARLGFRDASRSATVVLGG